MPPTPHQKACIACAASKRRCDKQLPECQRCLDRDADCIYPQTKRRRRDPIARDGQTDSFSAHPNTAELDALGSGLDFGEWDAAGTVDLDASLSDVMIPYIPTLPATSITVPSAHQQEIGLKSGDIYTTTACPWFLRDETWVLQHSNQEPACVTVVELEPFVRAVEEMLQCWIREGHNSFIHPRLYDNGLPRCLQDAFTTLAAYTHRTPAVTEMVLRIAEERSCELVGQSQPTTGGAQGVLAHLACVQALFVYEFILLFDGSVRLRSSAERHLPTLRRWVVRMWDVVRRYRGEDGFQGYRPLQWTVSEFDREHDASLELWTLWILTESVRRTHVVIDTILNIYQVMTKGWADCAGAVMFTARRGLWEAESAVKWFELSCVKPPLLVPSLQPGSLISQCAAEEVDDFVKTFWTFLAGKDKIQSWIDRSDTTSTT
ncbi:MAG: hypothetical protein OHK93_007844 [Ramalina farinacea]|uniref:Zn(2)-C6 fungal-type domain-containing protein n=1 Tax=Ramalina farinacea TaxID=258253 RepID=A0AA43QNE9_9LECA|nr:hypothetical protein [Ramalina farinacea]